MLHFCRATTVGLKFERKIVVKRRLDARGCHPFNFSAQAFGELHGCKFRHPLIRTAIAAGISDSGVDMVFDCVLDDSLAKTAASLRLLLTKDRNSAREILKEMIPPLTSMYRSCFLAQLFSHRSRTVLLFRAVLYLHENSLVHLDVKPSNILWCCRSTESDEGSQVQRPNLLQLADLGHCAKLAPGCLQHLPADRTAGTPGFRAPELELPRPRGAVASPAYFKHQTDFFSIGKVIYEICAADGDPQGRKWAESQWGWLLSLVEARPDDRHVPPIVEESRAQGLTDRSLVDEVCRIVGAIEELAHKGYDLSKFQERKKSIPATDARYVEPAFEHFFCGSQSGSLFFSLCW